MKKLILSVLFISISIILISCSCGEIKKLTEEGVKKSPNIFIGKIINIEIDSINYEIIATFLVSKKIKNIAKNDTIKIITSSSGASCGLGFKINQKWYIFSYEYENSLYAGLCGRSVKLNDRYKISKIGFKYWWLNEKYHRKKMKRYRSEKRFIKKLNI